MKAPGRNSSKNWRRGDGVPPRDILIHSTAPISAELREHIVDEVFRAIAPLEGHVGRVTVDIRKTAQRAERGGGAVACRINVDGWHSGPLVTLDNRGSDPDATMRKLLKRLSLELHRAHRERIGELEEPSDVDAQGPDEGSIIGRRVGRSQRNINRALERVPEERRAGGGHTARRNARADTSRMTSALEDSTTRPSRKSTRRSKNRSKVATQLTRRTQRAIHSPEARAGRKSP